MPVRSCLCSYGPEMSITVKHLQSIVYMTSMLRLTSSVRSGTTSVTRHQDRVGPRNQGRRSAGPQRPDRGARDEGNWST